MAEYLDQIDPHATRVYSTWRMFLVQNWPCFRFTDQSGYEFDFWDSGDIRPAVGYVPEDAIPMNYNGREVMAFNQSRERA